MEIVDKELYEEYHVVPLRPTKYKIDCDSFIEEIKEFPFQRWGDLHHEFPRFATPLVNSDGEFKDDDPACYPLDRWNFLQTGLEDNAENFIDYVFNMSHFEKSDILFETSFKSHTELMEFKAKFGLDKYKYRILYMNRNIRRKCPGDVALAYKHMMDKLTPEQQKECVLVFHAAPVDENGTDMRALCQTLLSEYPVIFTYDKGTGHGPMSDEELNYLYNS